MAMNLYLVTRKNEADFAEYRGGVVRSPSELQAKGAMAEQQRRLYGAKDGTRPADWTARKIDTEGTAEIILTDFLAG